MILIWIKKELNPSQLDPNLIDLTLVIAGCCSIIALYEEELSGHLGAESPSCVQSINENS